jgi:SAM-dependent methyltransferase
MASSPFGLFIGVANPFAPTMAVQRLAGWKYVPNSSGGLEIWLGSRKWNDHRTEKSTEPWLRPTLSLPRQTESLDQLYERLIDDYYEGSGFRHCGWWRHGTKSPVQACEALIEEIISFIDNEQEHILEIGCGRGATTRAILRHFPGISLTGLVTKKGELKSCQERVPESDCRRMKGPRLKFKGGFFDCVISVEGLKPFKNPKKLLREIYRVLKPGGRLLFSDLILDLRGLRVEQTGRARNIANSPQEFEELLVSCGFQQVQIHDSTRSCWRGFQRNASRELRMRLLSRGLSQDYYPELLTHLPHANLPVNHYVICLASKEEGAPEIRK